VVPFRVCCLGLQKSLIFLTLFVVVSGSRCVCHYGVTFVLVCWLMPSLCMLYPESFYSACGPNAFTFFFFFWSAH
jgi:hypothetical protein